MATQPSTASSRSRSLARWALPLGLTASLLGACSGGGGGGGTAGANTEATRPGGTGTFFVDPNQGGEASRLMLVETLWGRLVDIHDVDENGVPSREPVFRDFVINENVQSDAVNYTLESNPITQRTRLIIQRTKAEGDSAEFDRLLTAASGGLPPITPKNDDGTSPGPFSFGARNACLSLRFNDCLDDSAAAVRNLVDTVKVLTGYPPVEPYAARIVFDPNHGAVVGGAFHSTRVLIDLTVSEAESVELPVFVPVSTEGLPPSAIGNQNPNISVRIPTRRDPQGGQFSILRGLSGAPVSSTGNGPVDLTKPSEELVRAFRSGGPTDTNNGFLLDLNSPQVLGTWPVQLANARQDPDGVDGFEFLVDVTFTTVCQDALRVGDILSVGDLFLEVLEKTVQPEDNLLTEVPVRSLATDALPSASPIFGGASLLSTFSPLSTVDNGCWLTFTPAPVILPATSVSTTAQMVITFTEPMDPASVTPFDTMMLLRGDSGFPTIEAENIVVGNIASSPDLRSFAFTPILPLAHAAGGFEAMNLRLGSVTDLAGNPLLDTLPPVDFTLDPLEPEQINSSVAMRFSDVDELAPTNLELGVFDDVRGQIFYDFDRGRLKPRDVSFTSYAADRTNPVPSIMIPFPSGLQTPLTPLGSKLQTVWRYCDLGWTATD